MTVSQSKEPKHTRKKPVEPIGITKLIVEGYKSLAAPGGYEIPIRPLTLIAGANSSGKSSALQPLLLLKQTLEATYDPGPLLLSGPHVKLTSAGQIMPYGGGVPFRAGLEVNRSDQVVSTFEPVGENEMRLVRMGFTQDQVFNALNRAMSHEELTKFIPKPFVNLIRSLDKLNNTKTILTTIRNRCFMAIGRKSETDDVDFPGIFVEPAEDIPEIIRQIIHVPGLRGNPARAYPTTAVGDLFPGTFEAYVASIVHAWQQDRDPRLKTLAAQLGELGLTWKVEAKQLDATRVELRVGRLPRAQRGGARDLVNIADVGFGVSQTLPVLVALLAAKPGQLVYLEQPEIHLHPKAQIALASILAEAAKRGVRVVAETHSALLLLAVQALVAEEKMDPNQVLLHWFQRNDDGVTEITTSELDKNGAYGDWPEDFGDIELGIQDRYMSAVEKRLFEAASG